MFRTDESPLSAVRLCCWRVKLERRNAITAGFL